MGLDTKMKLSYGLIPYVVIQLLYCCFQEEEEDENLDTLINFFKYFITILIVNVVLRVDDIVSWNIVVIFWPLYSIIFWAVLHCFGLAALLLCDRSELNKL